MNRLNFPPLLTLLLGAAAGTLSAQAPGSGPQAGGQGGGHPHGPPPVIAALDVNHDGTIDAAEIAGASAALKTLDRNGDGKLTADELHPPRPQGGEAGGSAARGGPGGGPQGGGMDGEHRPTPPVIAALDANHDGTIDAAEIANAPAALKKLDKNGDGKLTMDELRPPGGGPRGGEGGGPPQH
jgi:hypothetical protein